jgi:hypothetical protein
MEASARGPNRGKGTGVFLISGTEEIQTFAYDGL